MGPGNIGFNNQNFNYPTPQKENISWINVNGVQGAKDVQVLRGQTMWLMDMNRPVFYVKEADNMGICSLKGYEFNEIPLEETVTPQEADYITKSEFEELKAMIKELGGAKNESINQGNKSSKK